MLDALFVEVFSEQTQYSVNEEELNECYWTNVYVVAEEECICFWLPYYIAIVCAKRFAFNISKSFCSVSIHYMSTSANVYISKCSCLFLISLGRLMPETWCICNFVLKICKTPFCTVC